MACGICGKIPQASKNIEMHISFHVQPCNIRSKLKVEVEVEAQHSNSSVRLFICQMVVLLSGLNESCLPSSGGMKNANINGRQP